MRAKLRDGTFDAEVALNEQLKRSRIVYLRKADIPANIAGRYRDADGHEIILHDDVHGVRLSALGARIITIIEREEGVLHLRFNAEKRTVHVEVLATV